MKKIFGHAFLGTQASREHRAWHKIFFKELSRTVFNVIENEFQDPENERFKDPTGHTPAVPDVLNSTPVSLLLFEAELLYESCEQPDVRQHPILRF